MIFERYMMSIYQILWEEKQCKHFKKVSFSKMPHKILLLYNTLSKYLKIFKKVFTILNEFSRYTRKTQENLHDLKIQMEQMHFPNTIKTYNLNSVQYFENHTKPLVPKTNRKMNIFYE
jgi:hypothetical protein